MAKKIYNIDLVWNNFDETILLKDYNVKVHMKSCMYNFLINISFDGLFTGKIEIYDNSFDDWCIEKSDGTFNVYGTNDFEIFFDDVSVLTTTSKTRWKIEYNQDKEFDLIKEMKQN